MDLARLARQFGPPLLQEAWQEVTGQPVPQPVLNYITIHRDGAQEGNHD